jgi:hypothetical protein
MIKDIKKVWYRISNYTYADTPQNTRRVSAFFCKIHRIF